MIKNKARNIYSYWMSYIVILFIINFVSIIIDKSYYSMAIQTIVNFGILINIWMNEK